MEYQSDAEIRSRTQLSGKSTDIRAVGAEVYLLPVQLRIPLRFGRETLTSVTCARVRLQVRDTIGRTAFGWGETPLSVQWAWPSELDYARRYDAMIQFLGELANAWSSSNSWGHPLEVGHDFLQFDLPRLRRQFNHQLGFNEPMPELAALVCASAFDVALHDAYGVLHDTPIYETYHGGWMNRDLSQYLEPAEDSNVDFRNKYPHDFLVRPPSKQLVAWHLVGGLDALDRAELPGEASSPGNPVLLPDWIARDGLKCLKIKLRGHDALWDYDRIVRVGRIALEHGVEFLSVDFNCTVTEPVYVNDMLDRLAMDESVIYERILYVEQPFPYELEDHPIDVRSVSRRKPLFMDESAHSWEQVRRGRTLGWTGVALKTCKTQTGALLSLCWAKAHGMDVMVQDLTNPMLAQIPHVLLAAHAGTIRGVETNAMQFYPQASELEAAFHPGLYVRRNGCIDLSTVQGPGYGYRGAEAARVLPEPTVRIGIAVGTCS